MLMTLARLRENLLCVGLHKTESSAVPRAQRRGPPPDPKTSRQSNAGDGAEAAVNT